jgi:hypothetical protein
LDIPEAGRLSQGVGKRRIGIEMLAWSGHAAALTLTSFELAMERFLRFLDGKRNFQGNATNCRHLPGDQRHGFIIGD